jgi:DNA-binding NtrC family response regulator
MKRKIILVEDEPSMRLGVRHTLNDAGYEVVACADGQSGRDALTEDGFDLIITDLRLPDISGLDVMAAAKESYPDMGAIIITAHPEVETAVTAIRQGAYDYLIKPFRNEELLLVMDRFFQYKDLEQENVRLKKTIRDKAATNHFICHSSAMIQVMELVATVAPTDVAVRIQGESGTGKELVANALYDLSGRKDKPFLKINCAAIPDNLLESELFGYERGAFTGAFETQKGKFEVADGGTIFFDEIGDLPMTLQPKLLRILEDQTLLRVGSSQTIRVDVRMIFATSRDLKQMVADGCFREDLFYRINVVPVTLPPLRDRTEDIPFLIDHFMVRYTQKYKKKGLSIPPNISCLLLKHDYPGNVRELRNIIERAVLLSKGEEISTAALPDAMGVIQENHGDSPLLSDELSLEEGVKAYERRRIQKTLDENDGKKIKAAEQLGISRKVLWKKMKDLGIGN